MTGGAAKGGGKLAAALEAGWCSLLAVVQQRPGGNRLQAKIGAGPEESELCGGSRLAERDFERMVIEVQFKGLRSEPLRLLGLARNDSFAGKFQFHFTAHIAKQSIRSRASSPQPPAPRCRKVARRKTRIAGGVLPVKGD